jgi:translation elongation factor EF-1beta
MADFNVDISVLPEDVREKLAELDLELSEGKLKKSLYLSTECYRRYVYY